MTVIAGIVDERGVYLAADSFAGCNEYAINSKQIKLIRQEINHRWTIAIGYSGDFRTDYLLKSMTFPHHQEGIDAYEYVCGPLLNCFRDALKSSGYMRVVESQEKSQSNLLIAYRGRLFSVWDGFEAVEHPDYMAIGSGMYIALGSLYTTATMTNPYRRLELALLAASVHHPFVREPFVFEFIPASQEKAAPPDTLE